MGYQVEHLTEAQLAYFENKYPEDYAIETLEISHSLLSKTYRICKFQRDIDFMNEDGVFQTFQAINFNVQKPSFSAKLQDPTLVFQVEVINSDLVKDLDNLFSQITDEKITCIFRVYSMYRTSSPLIGPLYFEESNLSIKNNKLSASAKIHEFINAKFPRQKMIEEKYKGLKHV